MSEHCSVGVCSSPAHCKEIGRCFSTPAPVVLPHREEVDAAYRRGVQDGGAAVFEAVATHPVNAGRGLDLYHQLKDAAADALAGKIIVKDPDEQPLWEHLIEEAYCDFDARADGAAPFTFPEDVKRAFEKAVRTMLTKKMPAPDSENMQLREALCLVLSQLGAHDLAPTSPLQSLLGAPAAVRTAMNRQAAAPTDDELRRVIVLVPLYSDDENHAYHVRIARAVLAAFRSAA